MTYTLKTIAEQFQLEFAHQDDSSFEIKGVCGLKDNFENTISFVASPKFAEQAKSSQIPVFITKPEFPVEGKINLFSSHPEYSIAKIAGLFQLPAMEKQSESIHQSAVVGSDSIIEEGAVIAPNVVIGNHVIVGKNTQVLAGAVILDHVKIGEDCIIYPNATIREGCELHNRVVIQSGAVIGSDGYGFVFTEGRHQKIPQIGIVIIEDDVEVGANCTIDRGRFSQTKIGKGTKLDNLVHIGHNVQTGENCLLVAQTGVSGSTTLGNFVTLAGQTGVVGHIHIADGVVALGQSMITKSIKQAGMWAGSPARPANLWKKAIARFYRVERKKK
jgi:UDP-3-O-[3-hydroxymyristoyl] glucosamine N-acyltransferase